ncbi:MAG TPA: N-acetylmuramoyl-L-alanine amidase [Salinisphaeraceae bacterium]|nr:N-acetylmuramoyl-L-alanine amidase [Salinisphaeraceae bacterium]
MPPYRLMPAFALLLVLNACAHAPNLQQRTGYVANRSHAASAYNDRIRFVVLHYTRGDDARAFHNLLGPQVSSHYLITKNPSYINGDPIIHQLVDEHKRAWHAGRSSWRGHRNINDASIGIEIVNAGPATTAAGTTWAPYPPAQINAVKVLLHDLIKRFNIAPQNIVGHSDIAPSRKIDPGPAFPWQKLAQAGIGAWPEDDMIAHYRHLFAGNLPDIATIQQQLARYGYTLPITSQLDQRTQDVLRAFQLHFHPQRHDGMVDLETVARLWALNAKYANNAKYAQ